MGYLSKRSAENNRRTMVLLKWYCPRSLSRRLPVSARTLAQTILPCSSFVLKAVKSSRTCSPIPLSKWVSKRGIHILTALVRRFHPDPEIKATIQATLLAEEEKLTLSIEKDRDKVAANLEQAIRKVEIAQTDFDAETQKLVSAEKQEGIKEAAEIKENANRTVASLEKETAEIDAKAVVIAGQAEADVIKAKKVADAQGLKLQVNAYGSADVFNLSTFADMLSDNLKIVYKYSGDGTLWTDPGADLSDTAAKTILQKNKK